MAIFIEFQNLVKEFTKNVMVKLLSNEKNIKTRSRNKQNFNYDNSKIVCLQIFFIIIFLLLLF